MKQYLIIILFVLSHLFLGAQSQCPNLGFENGDFTNWEARSTNHPLHNCFNTHNWTGTPPYTSRVIPRFEVFNDSTPVFDSLSCNILSRTPPGKTTSARVGNDDVWGELDSLYYTISVSSNNNHLIFEYSAIVEEPDPTGTNTHEPERRPSFEIFLYDYQGNLIGADSCFYIYEWANPNDLGLRVCGDFYYRPWTKVGVDLRVFENLPSPQNEVTIAFKSLDCGYCGHRGYGYAYAECKRLEIDVEFCQSSSVTLSAPEGFNYQWQNGATTRDVILNNVSVGQRVWVDLINVIGGCSTRLETTIYPSQITADFRIPKSVCFGDTVQFVDSSRAIQNPNNQVLNIVNYEWRFGDGSTSNLQNPIHVYPNSGLFDITLIVTSETGCIDSITQTILVEPTPTADFLIQDACLGDSINITNNSSIINGSIQSDWDLGSGNITNNASQFSYFLPQTGTHNVKLLVSTSTGCVDSISKTVDIFDSPIANFSHTQACIGQALNFTDLSTVNNSNITQWSWNMGDGATGINIQNPTHTYQSSGLVNVTLDVISADGCMDDTTIQVDISQIDIDFNTKELCPEEDFIFDALSPQNLSTVNWDFDDNTTANMDSVSKSFSNSGLYNVKVVVSLANGCTDSLSKPVVVHSNPNSEFTVNITQTCDTTCIEFSNQSFSSWKIVDYTWEIENSSYKSSDVEICYTSSQSISASLQVTNEKGCVDTITKTYAIDVVETPIANFSCNPEGDLDILNPVLELTDNSINAQSIIWKIDTLATFSDPMIDYTFDNTVRSYNICLLAQNQFCLDSICKEVKVKGVLIYIPNIFTPNDDNINDVFIPHISGIQDDNYEFLIFNRWGELLFSTPKRNEGWDGKYKGKDVKEGVYVWKINAIQKIDNTPITKYGHVTVLRKKK